MPTVVIEGVEELRRTLNRMSGEAPRALGMAIFAEAHEIMGDSKRLVPVDTGTLQGSGIVGLPDVGMTGASVEFGYGSAAVPYAVPVHERSDLTHTNGTYKFLERPVLEAASGMGGRLAARIQRMWRR